MSAVRARTVDRSRAFDLAPRVAQALVYGHKRTAIIQRLSAEGYSSGDVQLAFAAARMMIDDSCGVRYRSRRRAANVVRSR